MKTINHYEVPTGDILILQGELGLLEALSLGDYGKDVNLKCNSMGLTRKPEQVTHTKMLPLTEKWVVTISTQYGCNMGCSFCDVPKVGPGINATLKDLTEQVSEAMKIHPEIMQSERLNIHFARMGEPTWNRNVIDAAIYFKEHLDNLYKVHPVVSTMMPKKNKKLKEFIHDWVHIKNNTYDGNAGLQISVNSTCEEERRKMFNDNACSLEEISKIMIHQLPLGRKFTLNFAVANYRVDPGILVKYFDPARYIVKLTPMHKTEACINQNIVTEGDYTTYEPYEELEDKLVRAGYDVLVFIASEYEDLGRITCGNAILSGSLPMYLKEVKCDYI